MHRPIALNAAYSDNLKEYFAKRAPGYEKDNEFHPKLARKLVQKLDVRKGDRVLDVATGTGYVAIELATRLRCEGLVIGVDISSAMLKQAQAKLDAEQNAGCASLLIEADIEQIDFHGPLFQHITCSAALPFLKDLPGFFQKARRWLKKGGSLVFNNPQEPYSLLKPIQFSTYRKFGVAAVNTGAEIGSPDQIKCLLSEAGFKDIQVEVDQEKDEGDSIDDFSAYVRGQWEGMLSLPIVDFAAVEKDTLRAARQQFEEDALQFLNDKLCVSGTVQTLPLTTLWTIAK